VPAAPHTPWGGAVSLRGVGKVGERGHDPLVLIPGGA